MSYLTSRLSRDVLVLAHQEVTQRWWTDCRAQFELYVSEVVLEEERQGDEQAAHKRIQALSGIPRLALVPEVEQLAALYMREFAFPQEALRDALRIALASVHATDYLLTWNCKHIASGRVRRRVLAINSAEGLFVPTICTPEELLDDAE